jgi:hypothetical protein
LNFPHTHHGETSPSSSSSGSGGYSSQYGSTIPSGSSVLSSGPQNSESCSDSGQTENRDSGIASAIPTISTQDVTTTPSTGINYTMFSVQCLFKNFIDPYWQQSHWM